MIAKKVRLKHTADRFTPIKLKINEKYNPCKLINKNKHESKIKR